MVLVGKFQVIFLIDVVVECVCEFVDVFDKSVVGFRIGIKKGGCVGMEYIMDLVEEVKVGDDVIEDKGVKLFVDFFVVLFLFGMEMDFEVIKFWFGFVFKNLNEVLVCGCGEFVFLQVVDFGVFVCF